MTNTPPRSVLAALAALTSAVLLGCPSEPPPGADGVGCRVDADCAALDADGDACNGTFRCTQGRCVAAPTPVTCNTNVPCRVSICAPATGECELQAAADGTACNDNNPCTQSEICAQGTCQGGLPTCPAPDDPCEMATCEMATGACGQAPAADFTPCDDQDGCTTGDACISGTCAGQARVCPDDDNPCTVPICDAGACGLAPGPDDTACDDGDPCTQGEVCAAGQCAAGGPKCASDQPCQIATCDPVTGSCGEQAKDNGVACDDSDPCTQGEVCAEGQCGAGTSKCAANPDPCLVTICSPQDGACLPQPVAGTPTCDDGDPCTLSDVCTGGACVGTPKPCASDDNPCSVATCDAGICGQQLLDDGAGCDDGDPCTQGDTCQAGGCQSEPTCPDDDNPCTVALCDADTGDCSTLAIPPGGACDDGDPCTQDEVCGAAGCHSDTPAVCPDDGDPCTAELCLPADGGCQSVPLPDGAACDDNEPCTSGEACNGGQCGGGEPTICPDDGEPCTQESCKAGMGCVSAKFANNAPCDDGDACTEQDRCKSGQCGGQTVQCESGGPCLVASCDPALGCLDIPQPDGEPCDDQNLCTQGTLCQGGECLGGQSLDCPQPGDPCLVGACAPSTGTCETVPAAAGSGCDDGDPCTVADACQDGVCQSGVPLDCGVAPDACVTLSCDAATGACVATTALDGADCNLDSPCAEPGVCQSGTCSGAAKVSCAPPADPCQVARCDPADGQCVVQPAAEEASCDDGDPCTQGSICQGGQCVGGVPAACPDDGDDCTVESCESGVGCVTAPAPDGALCGDNDPCTEETFCQDGACGGGIAILCPSDHNPCTADACVPLEGCVYAPLDVGTGCDDQNACTTGETCQAGGVCGAGTVQVCPESADPCQVSACDPQTGACGLLPASDGTACDDGSVCTVSDQCHGGVCGGTAISCTQDNNPCTVFQCAPAVGKCVAIPTAVGLACDDGAICTVGDVCDGQGGCHGGPKPCPAPEGACETATCDPTDGTCGVGIKADGAACTDADLCTGGDLCLQGVCVSGAEPTCPSVPCFDVACVPADGSCALTAKPDGAACNDGDACTSGDVCASGECLPSAVASCAIDAGPCELAVCNPATGACEITIRPDGDACEDLNPCTEADTCVGGACGGTDITCATPADPCAVAQCDVAAGGCVQSPRPDGAPCDDGDLCTQGEICAGGTCAGPPTSCVAPASDCQTALCDPVVGCVSADANEGGPCGDLACRVGASCHLGQCQGGAALQCPTPSDPCLDPACSQALGCYGIPKSDGAPCDDGDPCSADTTCLGASCGGGVAASCGPAPPCFVAVCEPGVGCNVVPAAQGTACEDPDPCTTGDQCDGAGLCLAGAPKPCAGGGCLPEHCDPTSGACVATPAPDGSACDLGSLCIQGATCHSGVCQGGLPVSCPAAADPCVVATCVPTTGACVEIARPDGQACDDGSLCTEQDTCAGGICVGQSAVSCPAPSGCLFNICDPATGSCVATIGDDGAPCDDGAACSVGEVCAAGACGGGQSDPGCCLTDQDCEDDTVCTQDSCLSGRCVHAEVALEACLVRVVVAGRGDGELTILDGATLAEVPGSPVTVSGLLEGLAGADSEGLVFAAMTQGLQGVLALDPFQPAAKPQSPAPADVAVAHVLTYDAGRRLLVVHVGGAVESYNTDTGALADSGQVLLSPSGAMAADSATGRVFSPSSMGWLSVLETRPGLLQPAGTPWLVGGAPSAVAFDAEGQRVFLADPALGGVRVVSAKHGSVMDATSLVVGASPSSVAIDATLGRLFVTYPAANVVRAYRLVDLTPAPAPAVTLPDGPVAVVADPPAGRLFVVGGAGDKLFVLDAETLSPLADPPLPVAHGPVDAAVVRSRPGILVVTEAMINPTAVSDAAGEWFELHNPGTKPVSLAGLVVATASAFVVLPAIAPTIAPGGYATLCRNADLAQNGGVVCAMGYSGLALTNTGAELTLQSADGAVIDHAVFGGPIPAGQSLALKHPGFNNARRYSWAASAGTPGAPNTDVAP